MALAGHVSFLLLLAAAVVAGDLDGEACAAGSSCGAAEDEWDLDALVDQESEEATMVEVTLLQTQLKQQRGSVTEPLSELNLQQATAEAQAQNSSQAEEQAQPSDEQHVLSLDHDGKVCMLCNKPLPQRVGDRQYAEFRKDCGRRSTPTGPSAEDMALPAVQLWQGGNESGFCELNFAKSCADAVANKDYLYWPKSIDLEHPSMRSNVRWDSRYCTLNGFLDRSVVELQHDFTAMQQKARELCQTKYAKHGIDRLTFLDMLELSKHDDDGAPSLEEAEKMAAWNCAMGDLGCDMAMCAYSFCSKGEGSTGLYSECKGWDPVAGMPL